MWYVCILCGGGEGGLLQIPDMFLTDGFMLICVRCFVRLSIVAYLFVPNTQWGNTTSTATWETALPTTVRMPESAMAVKTELAVHHLHTEHRNDPQLINTKL
jgi:hypothetical protein